MNSKYDKLHDEFWNDKINKAGTRYERLAAFVMKSLFTQSTVVHDVKLIGESEVKHQIDVNITDANPPKRILIECKDFDISKDKVGLGIIRDFSAVLDDVKPDEAIVITCIGFTSDAQKFAKYKGIKLAVLREFQEEDWEGRCKKICVTMNLLNITDPKISFMFKEQADIDKYISDCAKIGSSGNGVGQRQPIYLHTNSGKHQVTEYISNITNRHPREQPGNVHLELLEEVNTLEVESLGEIPIDGIVIDFEIVHTVEYFEVTSDKIAKLLLTSFGDKDIAIFDKDIQMLKIDPNTGTIQA